MQKPQAFSQHIILFLRSSVAAAIFLFGISTAFSQNGDNSPSAIDLSYISGTNEQKRDALFKIKNLQNEAASKLAIVLLSDRDEVVRATAATAVIYLDPEEAAANLIPLLKDRKPFVRREAAYALGLVGQQSSIPELIRLAEKDKENDVRSAAALALGSIGDPSAIPTLVKILSKAPKEETEFIRSSAAGSIGFIAQRIRGGRPQNIPQDFLPQKFKLNTLDTPPATKIDPQFLAVVHLLNSLLTSKKEASNTRRNAAFALGCIADPSSTDLITKFLNDPDPFLAEIAKESLLRIDAAK